MYLILSFPRPSQGSAIPEDKTRGRRDSGSGRVTSPPPISLGRKVEVDLKEKQRKFEGLDRKAEQVILAGVKTSWRLVEPFSSLQLILHADRFEWCIGMDLLPGYRAL